MAFIMRQLRTGSIGETMKSLRKRQGISLDMVSKATCIQRKYVIAFENDEYHNLPDPLYARHFLRLIIQVLHGDAEYFLSRFDEECGTCPAMVDELRTPRQRISKQLLTQWRKLVSRVLIGGLALLLLFYMGQQIHTLLAPPDLLVDTPNSDIQTATATLIVSGQTEPEVQIKVNDSSVLADPTGRFTTKITLTRGLNIVTVEAQKKYGRPKLIQRTVYLEGLDSIEKAPSEADYEALSRVIN
jgi:cytoskeletal protein RodZ